MSCENSVAGTCEHVGALVRFFSQGKLGLTAPILAGKKTQHRKDCFERTDNRTLML
tara:strand:- start:184 stop:351 length:168 start_codon:yes stop_codon:yes gene_type:complete